MFSEKKDKKEKSSMEPSASQNRINEGTSLKGDVVSDGFFRIDGKVEGTVSKPSKVVIGKSGIIIGKLTCDNADIEGKFEGILDVTGTLTLKSTAHIEGEVVVGKLAVEPGATFNASCIMHGSKPKGSTGLDSKGNPYDRQQRAKKSATEQAE